MRFTPRGFAAFVVVGAPADEDEPAVVVDVDVDVEVLAGADELTVVVCAGAEVVTTGGVVPFGVSAVPVPATVLVEVAPLLARAPRIQVFSTKWCSEV